MKPDQNQAKIWIIQHCINAFKNLYEDWPGYCENPMTYYEEMRIALKECDDKWGISHDYEFRGHNIHTAKN